jgi:hypothetical protein
MMSSLVIISTPQKSNSNILFFIKQ